MITKHICVGNFSFAHVTKNVFTYDVNEISSDETFSFDDNEVSYDDNNIFTYDDNEISSVDNVFSYSFHILPNIFFTCSKKRKTVRDNFPLI